MFRRAFTVIELLIVLAISALFSTLAITYSSVGRNEIALSVEEAKIAQFILQAKALSIATYTSNGTSCAYGFMIDGIGTPDTKYSIFSYGRDPAATVCPPASSIAAANTIDPDYESMSTPGTWQIAVTNGVKVVQTAGASMAILFYPPDPTVFLSSDGTDLQPGSLSITLETVDGKNQATISVNPEGQVSL